MNGKLLDVPRDRSRAVYSETVKAGTGWMHIVKKGQILRIVDLRGNQSVDMLLYNAGNPAERYNVNNTLTAQRKALIELGTEKCDPLHRPDPVYAQLPRHVCPEFSGDSGNG